jgi:hypothetical protein
MELQEPRLQTPERPVPLAGIYKAIKRFNRNTTWVATGLLAPVIFAAVMLALQERHAKADNLTEEARQTTGDPLLNANPAAISDIVGSNEMSTGEITSGQATSVDRGLTPEKRSFKLRTTVCRNVDIVSAQVMAQPIDLILNRIAEQSTVWRSGQAPRDCNGLAHGTFTKTRRRITPR